MSNPIDTKPSGSFADSLSGQALTANQAEAPATAVAGANAFTLTLSSGGTQLGWVGQNSDGWGILVGDPSQALVFEKYLDSSGTYYCIKGTTTYMSVNRNAYIGFYPWSGATTFGMQGTNLVAGYNGQKLSLYSNANGYLYAWSEYTVLDVGQVAQ